MATIERLGLSEIGEVFMVGEDLHGKGGIMEIVAPRLQGANNSEEFAVVNIVVSFGGRKGL